MLEREREDDSTASAERKRVEEPQRPSPAVANVLSLQRTLGNRGVAELLARPRLQRTQVGGDITFTGQRHHPDYKFTFPGQADPQSYHFDEWFSGKSPLEGGYASTITADAVTAIAAAYTGAGSILDKIVSELVGTSAMPQPDVAKLSDKGYSLHGTFDVKDQVAATAEGRKFAQHFLVLQSNVALRVADMSNNVITKINVKQTRKTPAKGQQKERVVPYALSWGPVLAAARALLAAELQAANPAPAKEKVDLATRALLTVGGNFETLRDMGIIEKGTGKYKTTGKSGSGKDIENHKVVSTEPEGVVFNFGLNHLRAILYMEWRAFDELRKLAVAQPQQQPGQQLAQATQQLVGVD